MPGRRAGVPQRRQVYHHVKRTGATAVPREPTSLQGYAAAIGVVAVAFALRYSIYGTLDNRLPFAFFVPATVIAAWYGGVGPGLLAGTSGLLLGDYFFLPPHHAWGPVSEAERTAIGLYAINVTLIVVLFWNLHARLRDREDELRRLKGEEERKEPASATVASPEPQAGTTGQARPL
jgi:K+-sensing histidine kinase KdpD